MAKAPSLLNDIMAKALTTRFWIETMPPDFVKELEEVRQSFAAGSIPARRHTIAKVVVANGKARGIRMPSEKAVADWLTKESD